MFDNYRIGVYNQLSSTKVSGITIQGDLAWVRDIDCDMQPYSTELLMKEYGYDIQVTKRFFIDNIEDIKIGTILQYGTKNHEVKKVINWDSYLEAMTLEVL